MKAITVSITVEHDTDLSDEDIVGYIDDEVGNMDIDIDDGILSIKGIEYLPPED